MRQGKLLTKVEKDGIIEEYLTTQVSSRDLASRYGISSSSILMWAKEKNGTMTQSTKEKEIKGEVEFQKKVINTDPMLEIKRLRKKLEEIELEKEFYREIVNLAEKELGINLKKNLGKKQ